MSIGLGVTKTYVEEGANLNSTSTELVVPVVKPLNVYRFGVIVDSSDASGTALSLDLIRRSPAGDDANDVVLATLSPTVTVAQGEGVYFNLTGREEVNPGDELVVQVETAGAASSTGHIFVEVVEYPFQRTGAEDRLANMTEET